MKAFRLGVVCLCASVLLSGCGAAVRKSGLAPAESLAPVAIYLRPCAKVVSTRGAAVIYALCRDLPSVLKAKLAASGLKYEIVQAAGWGENNKGKLIPNFPIERAFGARFRVIVDNVTPALMTTPVAPGPGPKVVFSYLQASVQLVVEDAVSNQHMGTGLIMLKATPDAVSTIAQRIVNGLTGPRCESINNWSLAGAFRSSFGSKCNSFSIDDDSGLSKNPLRNMFGAGKAKDEQ